MRVFTRAKLPLGLQLTGRMFDETDRAARGATRFSVTLLFIRRNPPSLKLRLR